MAKTSQRVKQSRPSKYGTRAAEAQAEASVVSEEERQAKHEAEQAALEQLKEENPEAYATPPRPTDEGEDAATLDEPAEPEN